MSELVVGSHCCRWCWPLSASPVWSMSRQQTVDAADRSISVRSTNARSDELGEQRAAEAELVAREKKRKKLDIVELTPEARDEHAATWQRVQTDFVDAPSEAVGRAERLVTRVMRERGYPIDDFDQRAADISVDHPDIVDNYRSAHAIYQSQHDGEIEHRRGAAGVRALPRTFRPVARNRSRRPRTQSDDEPQEAGHMTTHETQPEMATRQCATIDPQRRDPRTAARTHRRQHQILEAPVETA